MNNEKLARFIMGLGKFNDYGSTLAQTKEALERRSTEPLRSDNDDRVIFEDALRAIESVKKIPFDVNSIIAINSQFSGDSDEQPYHPGRLRDSVLDPIRDRIHVGLWPSSDGSTVSYYPPAQVDEYDLEDIVSEWTASKKLDQDAWTLFARLAKLQPFQDGNKRTALIAANHALGAFQTEEYLVPPAGRNYNRFMDHLLGFYGVGLEGGPSNEKEALTDFLEIVPIREIQASHFASQEEDDLDLEDGLQL